ncbi:MAG: amidase [Coxiellaceae bacterium]|nr:MAG: amidase [Coxiellaceae bacterium]
MAALANKTVSVVELVEHTIARIESIDLTINAIPVRDFERARVAAKAADAAMARGDQRPLLGLPMSVKESFNVTGLPTTWANPQYQNWYPAEDSLAVTRLKAAGAIIIGKSNVSYMLQDWQSYNDMFGTTNNPWDLKLTPGGSSGGSAAALAAGLVSLELGSDLAGSLRAPAHFCGIYSHKPSQDLIPMRGSGPPTMPPSPGRLDLVAIGPMARTAADLRLALNVLAGPDDMLDGKGYRLALPAPRQQQLSDYRVLILDSHPLYPTAEVIQQSLHDLADRLAKRGVTVSRDATRIPSLAKIAQSFALFLAAFLAADMPIDIYQKFKNEAEKLSADDSSLGALFLRGFAISYRDWMLAMRARGALRQQWRSLFKDFDVIICPTMPTLAFPHDHSDVNQRQLNVDGQLVPYDNQFIWISIATLLGLPATVAPIGHAKNGLPVGVQIIGNYLEDYTTIEFAHLLEREWGGFTPPKL